MQQAKAYHTGGQSRPCFLDLRKPVIANSHSPQSLQPTDGPLDYPAHFSQAAAMRCSPPCDVRVDSQPSQDAPGSVAVEATIRVQFVGQLLRPTRFAAYSGEARDQRQQLAMVADVRPRDPGAKRYTMAIDHQRVLCAFFSAVYRAGASLLAATERSHVDAVDDGDVRIQTLGLPQESQQIGMQVVPNTKPLPKLQSPMGRATRTTHFGR